MMRFLVVLLFGLLSFQAHAADSIEAMLKEDRLRLMVSIEGEEPFAPGQRVRLLIRIDTQTWMTGGVRIAHVDVPDALVGQQKAFAANQSFSEGGINWTGQVWDIDIYPIAPGPLVIPSVSVAIDVAGKDGKPVKGTVLTEPVTSLVEIPNALKSDESWIVTEDVQAKRSVSRPLSGLKEGDAFQLSYRVSAQDVPVSLIPAVTLPSLDGLAIYPQQPKLSEKTNRGRKTAERVDLFTVIVERKGQWVLPESKIVWWHPEEKKRSEIRFGSLEVTTGQGMGANASGSGSPLVLAVLCAFVLLFETVLIVQSVLMLQAARRGFDARRWRRAVRAAWRQGHHLEAIGLLYAGRDRLFGRMSLLNDRDVLVGVFASGKHGQGRLPEGLLKPVQEQEREKPVDRLY